MPPELEPAYAVVAIGRNEGNRLKQCLRSASGAELLVYVDSGSTDGSVAWARSQGISVVELDVSEGFTAARARNAGFARVQDIAPHLRYVQFVDGDCELNDAWPAFAIGFLESQPGACAAFGRRRERHPEQSIYNRLCDREWDVPVGKINAFGGDVMLKAAALAAASGYRGDLIAGEEPELGVRLRAAGWTIWRLDHEMTWHDAAMTRFWQWWLRMVRSGYAFAQGSHLHGAPPERLWVWESRRAWIWGMGIPLACASAVVVFGWHGLATLLVYPLQLLRRVAQLRGAFSIRFQSAFFELAARFAELWGQIRFSQDRLMGSRGRILEYK